MASNEAKEDKEALDALEVEAKEFDKVRSAQWQPAQRPFANAGQDAEIDRILRAFRLDACVYSLIC